MEKHSTPKISLVQPNKVTTQRMDLDERQENIVTLMIGAIQNHMSKTENIQTDLFGQPMIMIDLKEVGANNKSEYYKSALKMRFKGVEYEYTNPDGYNEEVAGVLVTTVRRVKETSKIEITINPWAIPWLLYWGKGVGGTVYNKLVALKVRGSYAKRMYKLCKRWEDRGGFSMPLSEFRTMFSIETKYKRMKEFRAMMDGCIVALEDDADVRFSYSLERLGGSRSYNQINFKIVGNDKNRTKNKKTDMYVAVYNVLTLAYPALKTNTAKVVADKLADKPERLESFYRRTRKLLRDVEGEEKSILDVVKLVKYILKTDYEIQT